MTGTAVTSCAAVTVVTTTFFKTTIFNGAQFQNTGLVYSAATSISANTISLPVWGKVGPGLYVAKAAAGLTFITITTAGFSTAAATA